VRAGGLSYRYDAENQRVGVNETSYVVNSQPELSQVLVKEENRNRTFYVYGLGLLGEESENGYRSYHVDFRGSTVALTNERAEVVKRFGYGELVKGEASVTPFLFNGMYGVMTDLNGLYFMRARFYSPLIKRFVNRDVLVGDVLVGQSLNRFAFVTGNPVKWVDPFGLEKYCGQCAIGAYDCLLYNYNLCESKVVLPRPLNGPGVYYCKRPVNVNSVPKWLRPYLKHHWIKTDKYEAGMGGECPIPGQNCADIPYTPTRTKDHSGQSYESSTVCELMHNVDEECVNNFIKPGQQTGLWTLYNQCQSFSAYVIGQCRYGPQIGPTFPTSTLKERGTLGNSYGP
jgi:RHS repeat-associated protein